MSHEFDKPVDPNYYSPEAVEARKVQRAKHKVNREGHAATYPHLNCFSMDEKETDRASEFWDEHDCSMRGKYRGAAGGGNQVIFSPSGLGTAVTVKCYCGAEKNITNYSSW
jgi:hypothetical protein